MKSLKNKVAAFLQEFHQKSYFKQVLFSYIIVSCFTFLIFSILLLLFIWNENHENLLKINEQNIAQASAFHNAVLADIANYGYNCLEDATVRKLLYSDTYEIATAIASREVYDDIAGINSMITSLDFINFRTGTVLTRSQRLTLERYYDQDLLNFIQEQQPGRSPIYFQPRESYVTGTHRSASRVLSIIYYDNRNGALVINLDYDSYISQINIARTGDSMEMILLNQNNLVMAATNPELFMQDFSETPLFAAISEQNSSRGTFLYDDGFEKQTVSFQKNSKMGITYLSILHRNESFRESRLFGMTLQYSVIYIFVTLLLSLCFSCLLYRPVKKLKRTVSAKASSSDLTDSHEDDFTYLESVYRNLITKNSVLNRAHQSYEEQQQQRRLQTLLEQKNARGTLTAEELDSLDSSFPHLNYMIFIVDIDFTDSVPEVSLDTSLLKFIVSNVTTELFSHLAAVTMIETISDRCVFLANFEQFDQAAFRSCAEKTQLFFRNMGLFQVFFGFGSNTIDLDTLSASYEDAQIALAGGMLISLAGIQFHSDLSLLPLSEQKYPYELDYAISDALKDNNPQALDSELERFFDTLTAYQHDRIYHCIQQLNATIQRFEYLNDITYNVENVDWNHMPRKNLNQLKNEMRERCHSDINALLEIRMHSQSKEKLIRQVQDIVEENIYNPNLSVTLIAEQVGLSVNYLRNLYKRNTGESLSAYITGRKLSLICELLSGTNTSIQEISDRLGFATKNYFFTFFKKHMNMTPNQYRSQKKPIPLQTQQSDPAQNTSAETDRAK